MPVRFDGAVGGYSAAADRAAAAARTHSTAAHHGALESEIATRTKRQEEAAAAAAAEAEAAAEASLLDMFPPWRLPGQPTRPRAVHIGPTAVELEWELLDGGGAVSGHQVRIDSGVSSFYLGCEASSIEKPCSLRHVARDARLCLWFHSSTPRCGCRWAVREASSSAWRTRRAMPRAWCCAGSRPAAGTRLKSLSPPHSRPRPTPSPTANQVRVRRRHPQRPRGLAIQPPLAARAHTLAARATATGARGRRRAGRPAHLMDGARARRRHRARRRARRAAVVRIRTTKDGDAAVGRQLRGSARPAAHGRRPACQQAVRAP